MQSDKRDRIRALTPGNLAAAAQRPLANPFDSRCDAWIDRVNEGRTAQEERA